MEASIKLIKERHSVRNYSSKPIETQKIDKLKEFIHTNTKGPFGNKIRFEIVDASTYDKDQLKELGVYGIIQGPKFFIAGTVNKGPSSMEDFGYCMERNILMATSLGLGTCWLGGALDRSTFATRLGINGNEIIPAITPIGYSSDKKTFRGQAIEFIIRASKRKLFGEIFYNNDNGNPLNENECGKYTDVLDCVRLAPSAGNMQPWRIVKEKGVNTFHFYQKELEAINNSKRNEGARLQNVDMGIAMCHFELAAAELGLKGNWEKRMPERMLKGLNYIVTWKEN